jgi:outer membrane protein TolC
MNLPVRLPKRYAAIAEAQARVAQRRAELARLTDRVNYQVQEAAAQLRESERSVRLYEQDILPAAERNVKSAQAAYIAGQIPFLTLVEAQRTVVELRDRYYESVAAYGRRLATLERVLGGSVPAGPPPAKAPPPVPPDPGTRQEPEPVRPLGAVNVSASAEVRPAVPPQHLDEPVWQPAR